MSGDGACEGLRAALRREGLHTVEGAFAYGGGDDLNKPGLAGRRRTRLELTDDDGRPHVVYLKRYKLDVPGALRRWARQGRRASAARIEFDNIRAARAAGVPTMHAVHCDEDSCPIGAERSFLIVTAVPGDAMERCFEDFLTRHGDDGRAEQVAVALARLVRTLHDAGFVHRDLYASHVFLDESGGEPELYLIDLARMFPTRLRTRRWFVRDLAQLKCSLPGEWVRRHWAALLAEYLPGVSGPAKRRFDAAVDRKARAIGRRRQRSAAPSGGPPRQ